MNWRIALMLASALPVFAQDAPPGLIKRIIERETATQKAQSDYTYRQTVMVEEFDSRGNRGGEYKEVRDIIFLPSHERSEQPVGKPVLSLVRMKMTEEDFRDLREVQPFLLTRDRAFLYETRFRGEETIDGIDCWVVQIRPRQILQGQRLFDGMLWVDKKDDSIIRSQGAAVPEILTIKSENLFPRFTTTRAKIEGGFWFPVLTLGDDTLQFRAGPLRMRLTIRYANYRRFGAESQVTFDK